MESSKHQALRPNRSTNKKEEQQAAQQPMNNLKPQFQ
jgi:hypothetical protein